MNFVVHNINLPKMQVNNEQNWRLIYNNTVPITPTSIMAISFFLPSFLQFTSMFMIDEKCGD